MSIVKMKKLSLSVYDSLREGLLIDLQKAGCVHLENVNEAVGEAETAQEATDAVEAITVDSKQVDYYIDELEDVIEFLSEHVSEEKKGFLDSLSESLPEMSVSDMAGLREGFELDAVLNDLRELEKQYKDRESLLQAKSRERDDLLMWKNCGIDLDIINGKSEYLKGFAGSVPLNTLESFKEELRKSSPYVEVFDAFVLEQSAFIYVVCYCQAEETVLDSLKDLGFSWVHVSHRTGQVSDVVNSLEDEISKISMMCQVGRMLIVDYTVYLNQLKAIYDYLLIQKERFIALEKGGKTEAVSFYRGWFPAKQEDVLTDIFEKYKEVDYIIEEPADEEIETVPVAIESSRASAPFVGLTKMYGLPMYQKSMDPTPHFAPFYAIFYGFCLSDFFYGLIMFALFGFLALKSKKNPGKSSFMKMLSIAGLSAMMFGVIFGSFFGDLFVNESYLYIGFFAQFGLIDTMARPMLVLYISLILGTIHIMYGVFLNLFTQMRESVSESLFNNIPWVVFLSGFLGWAVFVWIGGLAEVPIPPKNIIQILYYLMMAGAGMIILNSGRKGFKKSVGKGIAGLFGGLYELYGATGYLSDLLSYARLLALGLSTGVIAGVFNFLAFDMILGGGMPLVLGAPLAVILLVFGHVFNLVISAFGAFVHALRLQFVEFFSKFIVAGGKNYEPLRESGVYHNIQSD